MAYSKQKIKLSIGAFLKQYRRKAHKPYDPNDRYYDRKLEEIIKKMEPEELSRLINYEDESE